MSNGQLFITITNRKITCHSTELWWNNDPAATNAQGARDAAGGQKVLTSGGSDRGTSPPHHLKDGSLSPGTYHYTITNWDDSGDSGQARQDSRIRKCPRPKTSAFIQIDQGKSSGAFELLVPRGTDINDYTHLEETILEGPWQHVHMLKLPKEDSQARGLSLIQNTSGSLEAIVRVSSPQNGDYLVAYEIDPGSDPASDWQGPVELLTDDGRIDHVTGTPAFIQSDSGEFDLLVPRGAIIDQYTHPEGTILKGSWKGVHTLELSKEGTEMQITSVSLIQNTLGGFEALARVSPSQGAGSDYLVAYEFDPESDPASDWQGPIDLFADDGQIDHVTGTPALIQDSEGEFELLVPRGAVTDQYTHEYGSILDKQWHHIQTLTSPDTNAQITANWLLQSQSGKLEAIARVSPPAGTGDDYLVGYESDPGAEWKGPVRLVAGDGPILAGGKTDIVS
jgi:hypothetical protein